jgi:hypothetical protein
MSGKAGTPRSYFRQLEIWHAQREKRKHLAERLQFMRWASMDFLTAKKADDHMRQSGSAHPRGWPHRILSQIQNIGLQAV